MASSTTVASVAPASVPRGSTTRVRPEIQGLRAVAVLLVVLYHLWPTRLTGGYVGVDVFFVISGFLITAHLLREAVPTGRVRLADFWARRARRLLPASLLVLALSAVATLVWVPKALWHQFLIDTAASATYVVNWVLAAQSVNYLAADDAASPVQHYWSLSAEEQFYLVWPLLVAVAAWWAARRRANRVAAVAAVLGVASAASFVWSLHLTAVAPSTAYFVTTTRAWQFGAGGLLAVGVAWFSGRRDPSAPPAPRAWAHVRASGSWAGLALIAWAGLRFDGGTPFPGRAALVPVLGAVLVIAAGAPAVGWSGSRPLGWRPARWLGDVSYSTYLWHWPPIVILPYALGRSLHATDKLALLTVVLVVAGLTKRWVEDPVRRAHGTWRRPRVTFTWVVPAMAVVVAVSAWGVQAAHVAADRDAAHTASIEQHPPSCFGAVAMDPAHPECADADLGGLIVPNPATADADSNGIPCYSPAASTKLVTCSFPSRPDPSRRVPHVALVGDSHARAMLAAFQSLAAQGVLTVDTYVKTNCQWSTAVPRASEATVDGCQAWRAALSKRLVAHVRDYDAVVTVAFSRQVMKTPPGTTRDAYATAGLVTAWRPVVAAGVPVIAIRDNPIHATDPNTCLQTTGRVDVDRCEISEKSGLRVRDPQLAAAAALGDDVHVIDLTPFYCVDGRCPAVIGGVDVYRDTHHITATYARTLAPYVGERLLAVLGT